MSNDCISLNKYELTNFMRVNQHFEFLRSISTVDKERTMNFLPWGYLLEASNANSSLFEDFLISKIILKLREWKNSFIWTIWQSRAYS